MFNALCGYQSGDMNCKIVKVAYHRALNGNPVEVAEPIPEEIRYDRNLIIDDILDSGGTFFRMFMDSPRADGVVAVTKARVFGQIPVYRMVSIFHTAVVLENLWLGGMGMDIKLRDKFGFGRDFSGVYVPKDYNSG